MRRGWVGAMAVGLILGVAACFAGAANAPAGGVRADANDVDTIVVREVPELMAAQRRLVAVTRTFLREPDSIENVLVAARRYRAAVDAASKAFTNADTTSRSERVARDQLRLSIPHLRRGLTYWVAFVRGYREVARDKVESGVESPIAWRTLLKQHDRAEEELQAGWHWIASANRLLGRPIGSQRIGTPQAPDPAHPHGDPLAGDWTAAGGVMRFAQVTASTFEGRLIKTYGFCRSGSVPLGQVEVEARRVSPGHYRGSVRYYRVSDCTFIGKAVGATWTYDAPTDTLTGCSTSPDPAYPGGGCETMRRVGR
ncbi:MAG: hypothetical protein U0R50_15685 [Gaiellales bacterium]